jgi:ribose transport system permease protein
MSRPNTLTKKIFKPETSSLFILVVMVALTAVLQDNFFDPKSLASNINAFMPLILMTMGQAVVIISGGMDLSAGSALSLYTCVLTFVMKRDDPVTGVYALIITFAVAMAVGAINGLGVGYLRISPVIVTFATSYIWLGLALFLRPTPGGESVDWFKAFYNFGSVEGASPAAQELGKVLPSALFFIIAACLIWFFVRKTRMGRYFYAVGSSNDSAYASGINSARVQMKAYMMNSFYIFMAALFFVGQNMTGDARLGDALTLKCIAAAVVGGIALEGGKGGLFLALVGALILSFVNKIIFFANIPNAYQTLVSGIIIIVAIAGSLVYTLYNKRVMLKGE